jgi:GNAT superfamily N-acetyltransferase
MQRKNFGRNQASSLLQSATQLFFDLHMASLEVKKEVFSISRLQGSDLEAFKSIRLEALQRVPEVFGATYAEESQMSDGEWLARLNNESSAFFALNFGRDIVGVTGILTNRDNPKQAILIASYIREEHRRKGGSELLYQARINWARERGFAEIIVSHRASNISSKMANQKHGFVFTHAESRTWNDGTVEDEVCYKLVL